MAKPKAELTEAEWHIIEAVWENQPCAAPTIQEKLHDRTSWSYSTVKTIMDRMAAKGPLKTEKMRNLILYRAAVTKPQAQTSEIMRTVKRAFDGALTPMMQFMLDNNDLTDTDLDNLEEMIKSKKSQPKS